MTAQLSRLSDKSKQLPEKNKDLKEREKLICRELETLEPPFNKMTRKSLGNQRGAGAGLSVGGAGPRQTGWEESWRRRGT